MYFSTPLRKLCRAATVAVALSVWSSTAEADVKHGPRWRFPASHYTTEDRDRGTYSGSALPLQVIFRGGPDAPTASNVASLLESTWRGWLRPVNPICRSQRYAPFVGPAPERRVVWQRTVMFGTNNARCGAQTHARFFSDHAHSELYGHSTSGHFMPSNFHRELHWTHNSFEPLQMTRRRVLRIASRGWGAAYCVDFNYGNAERHDFRGRYAGHWFDKYMGRISSRRRVDGC